MATTPLGFHYPVNSDPPAGPSQIQQLATDLDTYLTPLGGVVTIIGPTASQDVTSALAIITAPTATVVFGRTYLVVASLNGLQVTAAGTVTASLNETNSGFGPPLVPSHTASVNDSVVGSYSGLWTPNSGQTQAIWKINCSSSAAALRVGINCASISMTDVT